MQTRTLKGPDFKILQPIWDEKSGIEFEGGKIRKDGEGVSRYPDHFSKYSVPFCTASYDHVADMYSKKEVSTAGVVVLEPPSLTC